MAERSVPQAEPRQTLTTEDVRDAYVGWPQDFTFDPAEQARADFDRWLAAEKAAAWDEGYHAGSMDEFRSQPEHTPNPYAKKVT